MKQALLVISFGTSVTDARSAIVAVENALRKAVPERMFFRAFTSPTIRRILAERGEIVPSLEEALESLQKLGYADVVVQPTHLLYGYEYDAIRAAMEPFFCQFEHLILGVPLLASSVDLRAMCTLLSNVYPPKPEQVVVLLGHGTQHFANMVYPALQTALHMAGREDILIGTVEGWPSLTEILAQLENHHKGHLVLAPLMLVAGDHVRNDMAGSAPDSWEKTVGSCWMDCNGKNSGAGRISGSTRFVCTAFETIDIIREKAMKLEHYVYSSGRRLRCGYTTGTCAALAATGAVYLLLTGTAPETVEMMTPKGWTVQVPLERCQLKNGSACCAVRKDGGDDVDCTTDLLIVAEVSKTKQPGVWIDGGDGVGRITKPGLDQPIGAAAINSVPRSMIRQQVEMVCKRFGYDGGISVCIQVPGGEQAAKKTFNPELGIEGGISILGTSGIVEPMSVQALMETITLKLRQLAAQGNQELILTPGNYGLDFVQNQAWFCQEIPVVRCSNFIGEALDQAAVYGFQRVLLVGHIGKLVKLAGGIMNTHSRWADCRTELFCAHAAVCGASTALCRNPDGCGYGRCLHFSFAGSKVMATGFEQLITGR